MPATTMTKRALACLLALGLAAPACKDGRRGDDPVSEAPGEPEPDPAPDPDPQPGQDTGQAQAPSEPLELELVAAPERPEPFDKIELPAGFTIDYWAKDIPGARQMALSDQGTLFVGSRGEGNVLRAARRGRGMGAPRSRTPSPAGCARPTA